MIPMILYDIIWFLWYYMILYDSYDTIWWYIWFLWYYMVLYDSYDTIGIIGYYMILYDSYEYYMILYMIPMILYDLYVCISYEILSRSIRNIFTL